MGRPPGNNPKVVVASYVKIPQRRATCYKCGSVYTGTETAVVCLGCKAKLETKDGGTKKIPTSVWALFQEKPQISNSSIMGEAQQDGESELS